MKEIEISASTVDKAIQEGLIELGVTRDMVNVEIITKGSVFKKALVKLSVKTEEVAAATTISADSLNTVAQEATSELTTDTEKETLDCSCDDDDKRIIDFVENLLRTMQLDCSLKVTSTRERLSLLIVGKDTNYAIGYRGEALDAIQYLSLLASNRPARFAKKLIIDAEGYREHRAEALTSLSKKLAQQVINSGKAIELEPMNPFERRVIHTALQNNKDVTTLSEGDEPNRYVVISPAKEEASYDSASKNNFKKNGMGKTRSFGQKNRRF